MFSVRSNKLRTFLDNPCLPLSLSYHHEQLSSRLGNLADKIASLDGLFVCLLYDGLLLLTLRLYGIIIVVLDCRGRLFSIIFFCCNLVNRVKFVLIFIDIIIIFCLMMDRLSLYHISFTLIHSNLFLSLKRKYSVLLTNDGCRDCREFTLPMHH